MTKASQSQPLPRTPSRDTDLSSPSQSRPERSSTPSTPSFHREYSLQSLHGKDEQPWTRQNWEKLEIWYDKMDRDIDRATDMFYRFVSIKKQCIDGREQIVELWSKEKIRWLCQCLDTNTRFHNGVLPSQRKRSKKNNRKDRQQHPMQKYQAPSRHRSLEGGGDPKVKSKLSPSAT
ncbi:hypothetical protein DFQ28_007644 [Apophysomyces sp. BC1034]|nr:hypothetical protein DFQ30_003606 [Apophysomyces sp. BC1015]KAG0176035.1 hypothetical protein DFQ29_006639 [Apophysomyces sp. BC1021]KAG0186529.1 hypothetical protein DFQ28_007644 [Apophysomyces sp. BC1034]